MGFLKALFERYSTSQSSFAEELFISSPIATVIADENQSIIMANKAFCSLSGYSLEELIDAKMALFKTLHQDMLFCAERMDKLTLSGYYEGEVLRQGKDAKERLWLEKIQRVVIGGEHYYQCMIEDVTESRKQSEHFRHLAMHDALTGLANRSLAKDRFKHALLNTVRAGEKLGVLLCDLNEFKQVNDIYGHHVGDVLLIEVSKRLSSLVRKGDTVARVGGDEFLIIIERLQHEDELDGLIQKINNKLKEEFLVDKQYIPARISIGKASSPSDGLLYDDLLKIADYRMYKEKERYYGVS